MDSLDLTILDYLQRDGRTPYTEIAQATGVSEGTVRNRVYRLMDDHVIQIVGMVDSYQLGFDAPAIIGVAVHGDDLEGIAAQIAALPEVSYLLMVSGSFDLIIEVMCRDRDHLAQFLNHSLRKAPGIARIESFLILRTMKSDFAVRPLLESSLDQDDDDASHR